MPDRVAHDHPTVETLDGTLERYGGTYRPEIRLPQTESVPTGTVIRVVLDGTEYRAMVTEGQDGVPVIRGAYETPRQARDPGSAEDRLENWVDERDLSFGRIIHVDVIEAGQSIGIRAPGESATYDSTESPRDSLAAIARNLEDEQ